MKCFLFFLISFCIFSGFDIKPSFAGRVKLGYSSEKKSNFGVPSRTPRDWPNEPSDDPSSDESSMDIIPSSDPFQQAEQLLQPPVMQQYYPLVLAQPTEILKRKREYLSPEKKNHKCWELSISDVMTEVKAIHFSGVPVNTENRDVIHAETENYRFTITPSKIESLIPEINNTHKLVAKIFTDVPDRYYPLLRVWTYISILERIKYLETKKTIDSYVKRVNDVLENDENTHQVFKNKNFRKKIESIIKRCNSVDAEFIFSNTPTHTFLRMLLPKMVILPSNTKIARHNNTGRQLKHLNKSDYKAITLLNSIINFDEIYDKVVLSYSSQLFDDQSAFQELPRELLNEIMKMLSKITVVSCPNRLPIVLSLKDLK